MSTLLGKTRSRCHQRLIDFFSSVGAPRIGLGIFVGLDPYRLLLGRYFNEIFCTTPVTATAVIQLLFTRAAAGLKAVPNS